MKSNQEIPNPSTLSGAPYNKAKMKKRGGSMVVGSATALLTLLVTAFIKRNPHNPLPAHLEFISLLSKIAVGTFLLVWIVRGMRMLKEHLKELGFLILSSAIFFAACRLGWDIDTIFNEVLYKTGLLEKKAVVAEEARRKMPTRR